MKKYLNIILFVGIASLLTFTACTSDEPLGLEDSDDDPMALNFSVNIGKMDVTRATAEAKKSYTSIDGILEKDVLIGVYTKDADGNPYRKVYKVDATGSAHTATNLVQNTTGATGRFYWKSTSEVKVIEAVSYGEKTGTSTTPNISTNASGTLSSFGEFDVIQDQSDAGGATNKEFLYWYGRATYATYGGSSPTAFPLQLNHQLAKIKVEITVPKSASQLTSTMTLRIGKATTNILTYKAGDSEVTAGTKTAGDTEASYPRGVALAGTFTKPTGIGVSGYDTTASDDTGASTDANSNSKFGSWTVTSTAAKLNQVITPRVETAEAAVSGGYKTIYSAVVIPQNFEHKYMFVINYDGAEYIYTGIATDVLAAGKQYTYTITITPQELNVTSTTVNDWGSGGTTPASAVLE